MSCRSTLGDVKPFLSVAQSLAHALVSKQPQLRVEEHGILLDQVGGDLRGLVELEMIRANKAKERSAESWWSFSSASSPGASSSTDGVPATVPAARFADIETVFMTDIHEVTNGISVASESLRKANRALAGLQAAIGGTRGRLANDLSSLAQLFHASTEQPSTLTALSASGKRTADQYGLFASNVHWSLEKDVIRLREFAARAHDLVVESDEHVSTLTRKVRSVLMRLQNDPNLAAIRTGASGADGEQLSLTELIFQQLYALQDGLVTITTSAATREDTAAKAMHRGQVQGLLTAIQHQTSASRETLRTLRGELDQFDAQLAEAKQIAGDARRQRTMEGGVMVVQDKRLAHVSFSSLKDELAATISHLRG
ncbi:hypothetical protein H9P43_008218 [Blastocladiella emersonii ATCC 22665]|nr:hypothetical protein H9P43_008218 [Blastocladiella emersonii ATCC 22665]